MAATCKQCGGPQQAERVLCVYCGTAYSQELLAAAIPCPQCRTLNIPTAHNCLRCQAWLIVQCVFCAAVSPHTNAHCHACGEAFHGSLQRLQASRGRAPHRVHPQAEALATAMTAGAAGSVVAGMISGQGSRFDSGCEPDDTFDPSFDDNDFNDGSDGDDGGWNG